MEVNKRGARYTLGLALGALGVVYGDIGTSPLYAFRECFSGAHEIPYSKQNVFGVLSLVFWCLTIVVSLKYLTFVTRAANKGEGGTLALLSLALPERVRRNATGMRAVLVALGVFGASLLYGDGIITPAISVLGAVEGLGVIKPALKPYVLPIAIVIIVGLFLFQRHGTGGVGRVFGPVTMIWFMTIGTLGASALLTRPEVLRAINPYHAYDLFVRSPVDAFAVLGPVVLVVTGGEALYADMGHFGRPAMKIAWYSVVWPGLLLNYFGQGALVLNNPGAIENPFYMLAPKWFLLPLIGIATAAAVIASQALISGAFSLTMQAIQLGYVPRMQIDHTSAAERGQIYMPKINWALMLACIALVLGFRSSSRLASAYGLAVTLTMVITSVLFYVAARHVWRWSRFRAGGLAFLFLLVEIPLCAANLLKFAEGGWFTLAVAATVFTLMATWKTGRKMLGTRLRTGTLPLSTFLEEIKAQTPHRVRGTAVFLASNPEGTPLALMHNLKHNQVLHERVVILTIQTVEVPHVDHDERVQIQPLDMGFYRVIGRFGFMEDPDVPRILEACREKDLHLQQERTTFFLSRETIIASPKPGMLLWRERLFAFMSRNAQSATAFFRLPPNRVVELGMQIEI